MSFPPAYYSFLDKANSGKSVTIVTMGDSTTRGTDGSIGTVGERPWPQRVQDHMRNFFKNDNITVINKGVGGIDTQGIIDRFQTSVIANHPDLVIQSIGINDAGIKNVQIDIFQKNLETLIELYRTNGIPFYYVTTSPTFYKEYNLTMYNEVIRAVANANNVNLIDIRKDIIDIVKHSKYYSIYDILDSNDGYHPTQDGYDIMGDIIFSHLIPCIRIYGDATVPLARAFYQRSSSYIKTNEFDRSINPFKFVNEFSKNAPGKFSIIPIFNYCNNCDFFLFNIMNSNGGKIDYYDNGKRAGVSINYYSSTLTNGRVKITDAFKCGMHLIEFNSNLFTSDSKYTSSAQPAALQFKNIELFN